jgi:hypothetical protein
MKQFTKLIDAISYRTHCPICDAKLEITNKFERQFNNKDYHFQYKSGWLIIRAPKIKTITKFIRINAHEQNISHMHNNNDWIHLMTVGCKTCYQYSYYIRVYIDLVKERIFNVSISAEVMSIVDDENVFHEIRSSFVANKTTYSCFYADGSERRIDLPLMTDIPPQDRLNRIKKLLIFA